jgi:hypothetical protein
LDQARTFQGPQYAPYLTKSDFGAQDQIMPGVSHPVCELGQHCKGLSGQFLPDLQQAVVAQRLGRLWLVRVTKQLQQSLAIVGEAMTATAPHQASASQEADGIAHQMGRQSALSPNSFNGGKIVNFQGEKDLPDRFIGLESLVQV